MFLRFTKILLATIIVLIIGDFLIYNSQTISAPLRFQFTIPSVISLESAPIPLGFLILAAFCLGMIFAAFMGAISVYYRSRELKAKNRTIRELEREIEELRALYAAQRRSGLENPPVIGPAKEVEEVAPEPRIE